MYSEILKTWEELGPLVTFLNIERIFNQCVGGFRNLLAYKDLYSIRS
jgi:hypothetical protein